MNKVREVEKFIGDKRLYLTHYEAKGEKYVIFLPPLFEEMPRTRKCMVNTARYLADKGFDVIRFDYYGTGLSYGKFEEFYLEQAREDVAQVVDFCVKLGAQNISLLGFRFGAFLAAEFAVKANIKKIILWEPVCDLGQYLDECFKSLAIDQVVTYGKVKYTNEELIKELKSEGKLLVGGYALGLKAYDDLCHSLPLGKSELSSCRIVVWRRSTLNRYSFLSELDVTFCDTVKLAWDHIKYLYHESQELGEVTCKYLGGGI